MTSEKVNLIVEAGAGTGKTESLVYEVLRRLFKEGLPPEQLLALTFTEKAANEMRARICEALAELARGGLETYGKLAVRAAVAVPLEELQPLARKALERMERAVITTIHSFCAHVLRMFPVEAGVPPAFEVDSGERFEEEFRRAWRMWLDDELAEEAPRQAEWLEVLEVLPLSKLGALAHELCSRVTLPLPFEVETIRDPGRYLQRAEALLRRLQGEKNDLVRSLKVAKQVLSGQGGVELARHIIDGKPSQNKYADIADEAADVLSAAKLAPGARVVAAAVRLLEPFVRRFREEFVQQGYLTFDALQAYARRVLQNRRDVREHLKRSFRAILVDEFQDTDPIQYEIILYLAEKQGEFERDVRRLSLEPGKLYIVGDPKQSIYAFRGADLRAYYEVSLLIHKNGGETRPRKRNYRSRRGIIGVVNAVFERLLPKYQPLEADNTDPADREVEVVRMPAELSADEAREAEAEFIASWIHQNVKPGQRGHVAILLRTFTDVFVYLDALRRWRLPYVIEGERCFFRAQEVVDFANLLACVVNPHDKIALVGFLRSMYAGLTDADLFRMRRSLDYRTGDHPVFERLRRLHELAKTARVEELVEAAMREFRVLEAASVTYHGPQAVANLLKLRQKASGMSVRAFVEDLRRSVEERPDEGESPVADENVDAVKILTIHRSKGLEFDACFVPDMHRKFREEVGQVVLQDWSSGRIGVSFEPALEDATGRRLRELLQQRLREEASRVLYVAMTRAKSKLILTGKFTTCGPKPDSFADLLAAAIPDLLDDPGVLAVGDGQVVVQDYHPGELRYVVEERPAVPGVNLDELLAAWDRRRAAFERTVASPLVRTPSGTVEHEKRNEATEREPLLRFTDSESAREVGTVCHRVLESWDYQGSREELLARTTHPEARGILGAFWGTDAYRRIARAKILGREVPFVLPADGGIVSGVIDLVCELEGQIYVIDYKTDANLEPERYWPQLDWYVRAVGEGRPVLVSLRTGAWIER